MRYVDASHGGVVLGILPLATAAAGVLFSGERPTARFWFFALAGAALVVGYSLTRAGGVLHVADLALFGAIVSAGVGYAEGARLSKSLGGLQVISWALVFSAPVLIVPAVLFAPSSINLPLESWLGFSTSLSSASFSASFFGITDSLLAALQKSVKSNSCSHFSQSWHPRYCSESAQTSLRGSWRSSCL